MKVIILAAGQGTRLRPYTNDRPKCMVSLYGKPLLHHQLDVMKYCGINRSDIALVGGYLKNKLNADGIKQYYNPSYAETNMVETLFSAENFMKNNEDLIITYGDIIYQPEILKALMESKYDICVTADKDWEILWKVRMENPLDDAETFKVNELGSIIELGKKAISYEDVQAQYMGLIKVSGKKIADFKKHYYGLDRSISYDGNNFRNMYMTTFLQSLIDTGWSVKACLISNGWLEVDTAEELELYEREKFLNLNI